MSDKLFKGQTSGAMMAQFFYYKTPEFVFFIIPLTVLIGSMVSGAVRIRWPAPSTTGWTTRRYSSIKPVSTSDRANRTPP